MQMIIYASHFMASKLFHFQLPVKVSNHWTRRGKLQKCDYLDNEYNKYLKNKIKMKIKSICHNF